MYLEKISENPSLLKSFSFEELQKLSEEIRKFIIEVVAKNGGHLASNLGVVELTIALHYVFTIPPDKVIWDVGHQCYTHKILTKRYKKMVSLRKTDGISGFPNPEEDITDIFYTGHAGTAVSSATGLKIGQDFLNDKSKIVAVIGDGSLTNGLTFEGLNFLGLIKKDILIILNDNKMSISPTKGALSYYLTKLVSSPLLTKPKKEFTERLKKIPTLGKEIIKLAEDFEKRAKYLIIPGVFFEKLGLKYFGPIDGHDIKQLIEILINLKDIKEPCLLHIITKKGKGYKYAEDNPTDFHTAGKFNIETGKFITEEKITPSIFVGKLLEKIATKEKNLIVLTAAMEKGLGLEDFARKFPAMFFDVGIAESHCLVLASGLAKAGMKVVVSIYSTFLQRTYDQLFHDICLQKLPIIFLVDRAGIVGEDGPTHHGNFDISYLRSLPTMKIFAPYCLENLSDIFYASLKETSPVAIRYPRSYLPDKLDISYSGKEKGFVAILSSGSTAENSYQACKILEKEKLIVEGFAIDTIKPVDTNLLDKIFSNFEFIVTVEENSLVGGFGSAVLEYASEKGLNKKIIRIGLPDKFIEQGDREYLLDKYGLSGEKIAEKIIKCI